MERILEEMERAVQMMRCEAYGNQRGGGASRRELPRRLHALQQALGRGNRRRYAVLATGFDLAGHGALRNMAQRWSVEEEQRQREAEAEWRHIGETAKTPPLDATLWETYFDSIAAQRPLATLGAMAIWERLYGAALEIARGEAAHSKQTEAAGAGESRIEELCAALRCDALDDDQSNVLADGVLDGALMGLRLVRWGSALRKAPPA